jgi:hypothetical protein
MQNLKEKNSYNIRSCCKNVHKSIHGLVADSKL